MGTRGLMAFTLDKNTKAMYNHFDSYPSGLGRDIAKWLGDMDLEEAKEKFLKLTKVDPDTAPTEGQKMLLMAYADLGVSSGSLDDWYVLLRETQGDPQKTLDAQFYMDGNDISGQEWGYNIDLTNEVLEVYLCDGEDEDNVLGRDYRLVRSYPFDSADEVDYEALEEELNRELWPEDYED